MGDTALQLGVGGVLAILVIREVLAFLGKKKNGTSSGDQPLSYWQQEFRAAVKDAIREDMNRIEYKIDLLLDQDERDRRD